MLNAHQWDVNRVSRGEDWKTLRTTEEKRALLEYEKIPHLMTTHSAFPAVDDEKIDYIFVSRDIEVKSVKTIEKVASDHLPVVAEIKI